MRKTSGLDVTSLREVECDSALNEFRLLKRRNLQKLPDRIVFRGTCCRCLLSWPRACRSTQDKAESAAHSERAGEAKAAWPPGNQ